jgi:outer membrane protein OmpA-like peptidoglycan-associated protein
MSFIPFLRAQLASRLPQPVNFRVRQALELDRFSEFVTDISPKQKQAIENLALEIIQSNNTNDPIFEFRVEGHADIARTIPAGQRKQFEDEISNERAENGFNLLVQALKEKGGEAFAQKIAKNSKAFGLGTQRLKIPNASTKDQFEQNRRVVFFVRQVTFLPPAPEPPPPPTSVVEDRFSVRLVDSANLTIGFLKLLESFTLAARLEIVDSIDKKKAVFKVRATGVGTSFGPTKAGGQIVFDSGPFVKFKIFRLLGRNAGIINLNSFEGAVTVFVDPGASPGPVSSGGTLSFSFDALEAAGSNTQPTVIRVPSGSSSISAPSAGGGDVLPLGRMNMIGKPSNL